MLALKKGKSRKNTIREINGKGTAERPRSWDEYQPPLPFTAEMLHCGSFYLLRLQYMQSPGCPDPLSKQIQDLQPSY